MWIRLAEMFIGTFVLTYLFIYLFIKKEGLGLYGEDHNKPIKRGILTSAGIVVITVLIITFLILSEIFPAYKLTYISLAISTFVAGILGLIDDKKDIKIWKKVPLMLIPSLPIVAIALVHPPWNHTEILWINFGMLYWIAVVPIVYMGFSNGANIIAGYDGLEGGIYLLISGIFALIGFLQNNTLVLFLSLALFSSIFAFEIYNLPPSKVLLGNVGSFPIGGLLGLIPLMGHFEFVLPIVFLPHLVEFSFKIKYKGHTSVFGIVDKNGIIHNKDGIKSVLHWIISWGNMTEKKITLAMLGIEGLLCVIAFFVWYAWSYL